MEKSSSNYVVVNATAIVSGVALNILEQFVKNIPENERRWLVFVSDKVKIEVPNPNIRI